MFYVKIHQKEGNNIVAICDEALLGKCFEEGKVILEINNFYKGNLVDGEEVKDYLKENNLNLVGKEIIKIALELGVVNKESILIVKGVPHAEVF